MKKIISQSILVNPTLQHIHLSRNKIKCELSFKYIFKSIDSLLKLSQAIQQITYLSTSAERRGMIHEFFRLKDLLHFQLWSGSFEGHGMCLFPQEDAESSYFKFASVLRSRVLQP